MNVFLCSMAITDKIWKFFFGSLYVKHANKGCIIVFRKSLFLRTVWASRTYSFFPCFFYFLNLLRNNFPWVWLFQSLICSALCGWPCFPRLCTHRFNQLYIRNTWKKITSVLRCTVFVIISYTIQYNNYIALTLY